MTNARRTPALWFTVAILVGSVLLLVAGQTLAVIDYTLAVRIGLQESVAEVGEAGVQFNRAFGASDTLVYVPLIAASAIGLLLRRRWALATTAAVAGISVYWSVTIGFVFQFLQGVPGYSYVPGPGIWLFVGAYAAFGVWCLGYLILRGDALLR